MTLFHHLPAFSVRLCEQDEADDEDDADAAHGNGLVAGELADHCHQSGAHKGGTLAADVHQTVVFAGLLSRDDLTHVAAGKGLNTALEHTHQHRQHPELPLGGQENGKHRNEGIGSNTDLDQQARIVLTGQPAKENGEGEGHNLGHQKRQQQTCGIQPQGGAVGRGHIDDGVYTVNEEEDSQQVQEKDVKSLVIALVIYIVVGAVIGILIGVLASIAIIGIIFGIVGALIELYSLVGIILAVVKFLGVAK